MRLSPLIASASICLAQIPVQLKVIKGSPFSAQAITQITQELADGNRIVRETMAAIARDSEGRTRREQIIPSSIVFISDPVAGVSYVLESESRVFRRIPNAKPEATSLPVEVKTADSPVNNSRKANNPELKSEALGSQVIEGVLTEGTRITRTIPAGQVGNDRRLEVVSEIWYSSELQTIVLSKSTDPRLGETNYKLTDIQRTEPPHSLFEIPMDYAVREELQAPVIVGKSGNNQ